MFLASLRFRARLATVPASVAGPIWMIVAAFAFSVMNVIIRDAAAELHPFEVAFFRNLFSLAFLLPGMLSSGLAGLRTRKLRLYGTRALTGLVSMLAWFYALSIMPLGEAVALGFTQPLFATIGAALILREVVRARRWTATIAGFVGVIVIIRPGAESLSLAALLVLTSSAIGALSALQVKTLARTESTVAMVTYMVLFLTPMSLLPALFVWRTPGWPMLGWMVALGAIATVGHLALTRAFHLTDASALMPFDYAKLPFAALLGYALYSETMDAWAWLGAAIIAASGIYIARREAVIARQHRERLAAHVQAGGPGTLAAARAEPGCVSGRAGEQSDRGAGPASRQARRSLRARGS